MGQLFIQFLLLSTVSHCAAHLCDSVLKIKTVCGWEPGFVLNVLPQVRSKIECVVACSQDDSCRSSMFDTSGLCKTFSIYKDVQPCPSENFYSYVFESTCHVPPIIGGEIFSPCEVNNDCTLLDSECRGSRCQCLIGLSHDPAINECVPNCTEYGTTFQEDLDHLLIGLSSGSQPYTDLETCKTACIDAPFVCRSIEIWKSGNLCYLSEATSSTDPTARETNPDYDLHQRDCAPLP